MSRYFLKLAPWLAKMLKKAYSDKILWSHFVLYSIPNYYITFGMEYMNPVDNDWKVSILSQERSYFCRKISSSIQNFIYVSKIKMFLWWSLISKERENQTTRSCQLILFRHFRDILICTYKLDDLRQGGNTLHKIQEF